MNFPHFKFLIFLVFTLLAAGMVGAESEGSRSQYYTFGQCRISFDTMKNAKFTITWRESMSAGYSYRLIPPLPNSRDQIMHYHSSIIFHCLTGLPPENRGILLRELYRHNVCVIGEDNLPVMSFVYPEFRRIDLLGDNWKGALIITKFDFGPEFNYNPEFNPDDPEFFYEKPIPDPVNGSYCFYMKETDGQQVIYGSGLTYVDGDIELNKTIAALKTIRFDSSFVPSAPSFDCSKAVEQHDITICTHYRLSYLDSIMSYNYEQLKTANLGVDSARLIADQRAWIKDRNLIVDQRAWLKEQNTCPDPTGCFIESYVRRIDELCKNYPVASGVQPPCTSAKEALNAIKNYDPDLR